MNYTEAVNLALAGEERGYGFLYANTYKSKYYLALQYMKNEEAAQDVLQDAYIKAFSKLNTLQDAEKFPSWFGMIVANTAKNALAKNNPMLFSDITVDGEEVSFEYQIEDDSLETQPETAYTRKETQELVHHLIESLSEEQRVCILMFHIEGASIHEIAETLNCSENTVKSRLNYGRKNLKVKAEELQKKGYKLYGLAPLPLLLYLLRAEESYLSADGTLARGGSVVADRVFSPSVQTGDGGGDVTGCGSAGEDENVADSARTGAERAHSAVTAGTKTAIKASKAGLLHTAVGKAVLIVVGLCIVESGVVVGLVRQSAQRKEAEAVRAQQEQMANPEEGQEKQTVGDEENQKQQENLPVPEDTEESEPTVTELGDEEYPSLIVGNLTRQELEMVLAYGPQEIPSEGFQDMDYINILNALCQVSERSGAPIQFYGPDENWESWYSLEDVNRLFSSFTSFQFTEDTDMDAMNIHVDGDRIGFFPATLSAEDTADITFAQYTGNQIDVYYTYEHNSYEQGLTVQNKKAVLTPAEDQEGRYRITDIEVVETDIEESQSAQETLEPKMAQDTGGKTVEEIYAGVLQSVRNQEAGYEFPNANSNAGNYEYFVCDMNGDGIEELIVGAMCIVDDVFMAHDCRVFSCQKTDTGYELKIIAGDEVAPGIHIAADGDGLYMTYLSRGTGWYSVYRLTIQDDTLISTWEENIKFMLGSSEEQQFSEENKVPQWKDISDTDILG